MGFSAVGSARRHGILLHELGHVFTLPHWTRNKNYPYRGHMHGIKTSSKNTPHVGPTWAYDLYRKTFIPPIVQEGAARGIPGQWKRDPMAGGGTGDQESPYIFRHFSDYSLNRVQPCFENSVVYWNEKIDQYARWNQKTGAYDQVIENDGILFPEECEVDVVSILVSASAVTPEANIVYPPIGPYTAGLIRLFDATADQDREQAQKSGYVKRGSNLCLRVTQGGSVKTYVLPVKMNPNADPASRRSFHTTAVNLPARDGKVTQADLLYVPDVMADGLNSDVRRLSRWKRSEAFQTARAARQKDIN